MTHPYTRLFLLPSPPSTDDDITAGYEVGDVIVAGGAFYDCADNTEAAAVWQERGGGGAPHSHTDINNDLSIDGAVTINESGADKDTRIEGDTDQNLTVWDAGLNAVGMGGAAESGIKLKVHGDFKATNRIYLGNDLINNLFSDASHSHQNDYIALHGWIPVSDTWTRTGNHSFTVSGDVTATYRKNAKVKYSDGATDYGVIGASSHAAGTTTVTLITNTDYVMAAATITGTYLSYIENPEGWPGWFNYAPTYSASGSMTYTSVTTSISKWMAVGNTIKVKVRATGTTGGTANIAISFSVPVNCVDSASFPTCFAQVRDGSPIAGRAALASGTPDVVEVSRYDNANYGLGTLRIINAMAIYEF